MIHLLACLLPLLAAAVPLERLDDSHVEWVDADGSFVAWGAGSRLSVRSADGSLRKARLERPARDGVLIGRRLVLAMDSGDGAVVDLLPTTEPLAIVHRTQAPSLSPERNIAKVGRRIWIASPDGLVVYRDRSSAAQTFPIAVGSDFFSPATISIDPGDTLQWTNADGFHNVYSCVPDQFGCDGQTADETFVSGPPALPVWFYSHTFVQSGSNPYLCQSHATTMTGFVEVGGPLPPPAVPNGVLVDKLDIAGTALELSWDAFGCGPGFRRHVIHGFGADLPSGGGTFSVDGAECNLTTPFVWESVPDPGADPQGLLWWLVVATNSDGLEGSWGDDGSGTERSGPGAQGASGFCSTIGKNVANPCGN